jgi:hypothetical protein
MRTQRFQGRLAGQLDEMVGLVPPNRGELRKKMI